MSNVPSKKRNLFAGATIRKKWKYAGVCWSSKRPESESQRTKKKMSTNKDKSMPEEEMKAEGQM